jgi:hypothetical protein
MLLVCRGSETRSGLGSLDLTSKATRKQVGITLKEIYADWEVDPLLPLTPPNFCVSQTPFSPWASNTVENFTSGIVENDTQVITDWLAEPYRRLPTSEQAMALQEFLMEQEKP